MAVLSKNICEAVAFDCGMKNPSWRSAPTRRLSAAFQGKQMLIYIGLAFVMAVPKTLPAAVAATTTATLDAGGRRVSSGSYTIDGSVGSLGGISATASAFVVARHGYVGQLYDLQSLVVSALPTNVDETGTSQLAASGVLDDATSLSLSATNCTWSVISGPVVFINASGSATTTNVYQNTTATVGASYQSVSATSVLTVINTGNDDFGLYAHDSIDDAWQVRYFGLNNTNAGPNADPDGDGVSNYNEYIADTNPTNALSYFHILSLSKMAGYAVYFPTLTNQTYTLFYASNLLAGGWSRVPSPIGIRGSGGLQGLLDVSSPALQRFYRIASGVSNLRIQSLAKFSGWSASYASSSNRIYALYYSTNLISGAWIPVSSQTNIPGSGGVDMLSDTATGTQRFYRIGVSLP